MSESLKGVRQGRRRRPQVSRLSRLHAWRLALPLRKDFIDVAHLTSHLAVRWKGKRIVIDSISSSPYVRGFLASAPDFRAKTVNDLGRSDPIQPFFNDIINLLEGEEGERTPKESKLMDWQARIG